MSQQSRIGIQPGDKRDRGGGRKKGTPNHKTLDLLEKLTKIKCDPITIMGLIANNELPCGVCRGKGVTPFKIPPKPRSICTRCGFGEHNYTETFVSCPKCHWEPEGEIGMRKCLSCHGTLLESVSPALRGQMCSELVQFIYPKRKAMEVTGEDGGPVRASIVVEFVKPNGQT